MITNFILRCLAIISVVCFIYLSPAAAQPPLPPPLDIDVDDLNIPFGNVLLGNTADQTVTVKNLGSIANLSIGQIAGSDPIDPPFSLIFDSCSNTDVAPLSQCTFTVRFNPATADPFSDTLDIPSNDPDPFENPLIISMSGTGQVMPNIVVTDSVLPDDDKDILFSTVLAGSTTIETVTVTNDGNLSLTIGTITDVSPLDPFDLVNDNCSSSALAPSESCLFTVRFQPGADGSFSSSFDIPSNDPDENPATVTVSGNAGINNSPTIPQLVYPAADQSCTRTSETFIWDKSTDPDGDAVTYTLEICRDINFSFGCKIQTNIMAQAQKQTYYAGTGTWFFMVGIVLAGSFARKNRMALLLAVVIVTTTFILIACGGGGGDGGGSCNLPAVPDVDPTTQISQTVNGLSSNTVYFWKVKAEDGLGGLINSNVKSFTTQ